METYVVHPHNVIKRHIISREHFNTLFDKYPFGTLFYIPLLLFYHTGRRRGEVIGLKWQDVGSSKRINLRQQIRYLSKRGYFFTTFKTESSKRYIFIDDKTLVKSLRIIICTRDDGRFVLRESFIKFL